MGTFRFTYDDDNLKDIRVICEGDGMKDMLESIKIFCIDSIPPEYEASVMDTEDGFLVSSENHGEEVLTHIFRYLYLVTRLVMIFKEDLEKKTKVENLDMSLLRPDIEKVENLGYRELAKLIGDLDYVEEAK
jgi:hypothetical protein